MVCMATGQAVMAYLHAYNVVHLGMEWVAETVVAASYARRGTRRRHQTTANKYVCCIKVRLHGMGPPPHGGVWRRLPPP